MTACHRVWNDKDTKCCKNRKLSSAAVGQTWSSVPEWITSCVVMGLHVLYYHFQEESKTYLAHLHIKKNFVPDMQKHPERCVIMCRNDLYLFELVSQTLCNYLKTNVRSLVFNLRHTDWGQWAMLLTFISLQCHENSHKNKHCILLPCFVVVSDSMSLSLFFPLRGSLEVTHVTHSRANTKRHSMLYLHLRSM